MAHIQDRWYRTVPDPDNPGRTKREKAAAHGKGNRYKVRYIDPDGQEKSKTFPDKCKGLAEAFLVSIESDKLEGRYVDPNAGRVSFRDHAESWLRGQSSDAASRQTVTSRLHSQLYPFFEKRAVASITPAVVRDWLGWLNNKGLDNGYQGVLFDHLSSIMNAAVEDKKVHSNPCRARSVKRPKASQRTVVPWPESRLKALQLALNPRHQIIAPLGGGCGLRQGEILGFSADDIDRDSLTLRVERQIRVVNRVPVFAPPKGDKTRSLPLSEGVLEAIDAYQDEFEPCPVTLPWREPGGRKVSVNLLIVREDRKPWYGSLFNHVVWKPAFARAGLTYVPRADGMHAMRHLYASVLLSRGVSVKELAEYLGHSDAAITLATYTHLMPSSHERARQAVNAVFRPRAAKRSDTA